MEPLCRIELLGGLRVWQGERLISRFRTHKVGALLAYLAYFPGSHHPRETLIGLLWPEAPPDAARNSLSNALSSLRHQLEPPGVPAGTVLQADRFTIGLRGAVIRTDVAEFEERLQMAEQAANTFEPTQQLRQALELYAGPLLPGYYEDWALWEAQRLLERYLQATRRLVRSLAKSKQWDLALDYSHRAVALDPLREETYQDLMRLLIAAGQPAAALQQYRELEARLRQDIDSLPTVVTQRLAQEIQQHLVASPAPASSINNALAKTSASLSTTAPSSTSPPSSILNPTRYPTGTVTFLLLDAVVAEQQNMELRHLVLPILHRYRGHSFQEVADVFCAVFQSVEEAVACAGDCRVALAEQGTDRAHARMALHTGDVSSQPGSYHGDVLQHTASILQATHEGQVLCSEATGSLLRFACEPGVQLQNLGLFYLRGPNEVETLFQINNLRVPTCEFPAPRGVAGYVSRLPLPLTRFFGREEECRRLKELLLLPQTRLITLSGLGGIGKTRLAIEVARHLTASFGGAVWFVSLAELTDSNLIDDAILEALHLTRSPQITAQEQIIAEFSRQPCLLVLDNLEHLVEKAAHLVPALLAGAAPLKCLVTSRCLLEVGGEHEFAVVPLPVPPGGGAPEQLRFYESMQLFVDRAQSVKPDFQLTQSNAGALAQLCASLEGIPLALELAATRVQVLSVPQMLSQLDRRFDLLVSRRRDLDARHRTLRATIDWSYHLLSEDLQRFFRRLSVFRGTWTLAAAETVCDEPLALDTLAQLKENSLIMSEEWTLTEEGAAEIRFRMLETLREYGWEKLRASGEEESLRDRHRDYFLEFSEHAATKRNGPEQAAWLQQLALQHDNLRAALAWCELARPDHSAAEPGLRLARALAWFWNVRGHVAEGRAHLARALAQPAAQFRTAERAKALNEAGVLARYQGDYAAAWTLHEESLALFRELEDRKGGAEALNSLGLVAHARSDFAAAQIWHEESLALRRELGDGRGIAASLHNLGMVAHDRGDYAAAGTFYEESLALFRELGNGRGIAFALNNLGNVVHNQGDLAAARRHYEESLTLFKELEDRQGISFSLNNLAVVAYGQGDLAEARRRHEESLALRRELDDRQGVAVSLNNLGNLAHKQGDYATAQALYEEGLGLFRELEDRWGIAGSLHNLGMVAHEQGDGVAAQALYAESLTLRKELGDRKGVVECLESLATLLSIGEAPKAVRLWGAVGALREALGSPVLVDEQERYEQQIARIHSVLGTDAFATAWQEGHALSMERATEYALSLNEPFGPCQT
jgi:predicted ATPase/DNA-binding SARP family transcriptional activator